jgi:hypothetical protein
MRRSSVATDYDELRSDVRESQHNSLEALRSANTPDARSVGRDLDESETVDGVDLPGDFIAEELIVQVVPQADDEFTCYSCFLVRHRSQVAAKRTARATVSTVKAEREDRRLQHAWSTASTNFLQNVGA